MVLALASVIMVAAALTFEKQSASGSTVKGERIMNTRQIVEGYFAALKAKQDWQVFLADDLVFTSFTSPVKAIDGKTAFLESTKRFYSSLDSFEVREVLVDGDKACVLTRYQMKGPNSNSFQSDVAEVFTTKDNKIKSFSIYFDSAPFPK
jgi:ketosteroid isomerase-like protein